MIDILSLTLPELEALIIELGEPKYRAKQIYSWITKGMWGEEMRNIPKKLAEKLATVCELRLPKVNFKLES